MNFKVMPELNYRYGYPITLFIMLLIIIIGVIRFRRKKLL